MFSFQFRKPQPNLVATTLQGNAPGKTLLITAGVDGDEYAGIEAAHRLIDEFRSRPFAGRLIVVPIVNMPGFLNESSHNPIDGKLPKNIFPGKANGTSSEQIINELFAICVDHADCWLDLHGGAITEGLSPFLWLHRTGSRGIDNWIDSFAKQNIAERALIESCSSSHKASQLAKQNCTYIVAEAGERGNRAESDVALHVQWTKAIMTNLGMINDPIVAIESPIVMKSVWYVVAPFDGVWNPALPTARFAIEKGKIVGNALSCNRSKTKTMTAPVSGHRLWWKETMRMKKGEILCVIGY